MGDKLIYDACQYGMEGEDNINAGDNREKEEKHTISKSSKLPKMTNKISVPNDFRFKGITDHMEWSERECIMNENNLEYTKRKYEEMGIIILGDYDDLFYSVDLPAGWKIKATTHAMWNDLIDDKGRRRISFFYKAAYYDREAFSNFERRYSFEILPFDKYQSKATYEERKFKPWSVYITDCGKCIKKLASMTAKTDDVYFGLDKKLKVLATEYLDKNYPGWEDFDAYWD